MTITAKTNFSAWNDMFASLKGPMRESLARSMAVAGGQLLRDEAKARAPVGTAEGGSITPGLLRSAIYLAFRDKESTEKVVVYSVTWNSKKAPHGHWPEFGHWQTHARYRGDDGEWYTGAPLKRPKWIAAEPFLRPAFEAMHQRVQVVMIERGRERFAELLADAYTPRDEEFV